MKSEIFLLVVFIVIFCNGDADPGYKNLCHGGGGRREERSKMVALGETPYIVSMRFKVKDRRKQWSARCTGSIITELFVLSAAHCFNGYDLRRPLHEWRIVAGSIRQWGEPAKHEQWRVAVDYRHHPDFDATRKIFQNNIGVIKVGRPFDFSGPFVKPINLELEAKSHDNEICMVVTHGKESPLMYGCFIIDSEEQCINYGKNGATPYPFLCSKNESTAMVCGYEAGSPLICGNLQVAIVNSGKFKNCIKIPYFFVRVANYVNWIETYVEAAGPSAVLKVFTKFGTPISSLFLLIKTVLTILLLFLALK